MPDYAEMYRILFRAQVKAIRILQEAHQAAEEIYISADSPNIRLLDKKKQEEDISDNEE